VGAVSVVVVVVVELVATGGATTTGAGTTATGAGTVSTTGAGVVAVSSTVLWYEKHPLTIPHAAIAAGIIAIFLINRILVTSIGYILGEEQEAGQSRFCRICRGRKR
jgi:hypothetical protein